MFIVKKWYGYALINKERTFMLFKSILVYKTKELNMYKIIELLFGKRCFCNIDFTESFFPNTNLQDKTCWNNEIIMSQLFMRKSIILPIY